MPKKVQREKVEQEQIHRTLASIGSEVYTIGTRRRRGAKCSNCGTFVAEHQGTRQTEGLPDLLAFLPPRTSRRRLLLVEAKAQGGRLSPAQKLFRDLCFAAGVDHVHGDLNAVVAYLMREGYLKAEQVPHYRHPPQEV